MSVWGYSKFKVLLEQHPQARKGFWIDTNILVSATYDSDKYHDNSTVFIEQILENEIPLFCNVNIRAEFLEIHRRIIFSEAILEMKMAASRRAMDTRLGVLWWQTINPQSRPFCSSDITIDALTPMLRRYSM